jgi:hypothetical protein
MGVCMESVEEERRATFPFQDAKASISCILSPYMSVVMMKQVKLQTDISLNSSQMAPVKRLFELPEKKYKYFVLKLLN